MLTLETPRCDTERRSASDMDIVAPMMENGATPRWWEAASFRVDGER